MRYDDENGWKEHGEAHYARIRRMDILKAVVGALIAAPIMYAMMVIIMVL